MKLKIVSDGTPTGTRLLTEDGNYIEGVRSIHWEIGVDKVASAIVDIVLVPAELEVDDQRVAADTTQLGDHVRTFSHIPSAED
jgi:hypothetical protein